MLWIDRFEKVGRLVLWLTLASTVVILPLEYIKQKRSESQLQEAARKEALALEKELKAKAEKSDRLPLAGMFPLMRALNTANASGYVWFTNVSPRAGVVCVTGLATNPTTKQVASSLPACISVLPYASGVELKLMFAGGELRDTCKNVDCAFSVTDTPDVKI